MRRPLTLVSLGSIVFAIVILFASWGATTGAPSNSAVLGATPGASPEPIAGPPGFTVTSLGLVHPQDSQDHWLYLTKAELAPGAPMFKGHTHDGSFVLTVASGAICYRPFGDPGANNVVAHASQTVADTDDCATTVTGCDDTDGCTLGAGNIVYLPAGSWVTQAATAGHSYGNPDPVNAAVVYISGYVIVTPGAPCQGGCP